VVSTALAAADAGVEVQIVADACAGVSDADHRRALDVMRLYGPLIQVVTVADVLGQSAEVPSAPRDAGYRPATSTAPGERTGP
jgi:nicotinamidase-related amidase